MSRPGIDVQFALDHAAIRDLQERYFMALDRADAAGVRACFKDDVEASHHARPTMRGLDALMEQLILPFFQRLRSGEVTVSTHFMGNFRIEQLDGATAQSELYAIATHGLPDRSGATHGRLRTLSLRYLDRLERTGAGWKVSRRVQTVDWACETPATQVTPFARRVMAP